MNKIFSLLTLTSLTLAGSILTAAPANAFEFSVESNIGNDFTYTITLDSDDSLEIGDQLILTNLSGVTAASSSTPYQTVGFDSTSANFTVNTLTNGAATLSGVVQLTSLDALENLEYTAFFTDNGTPSFASNGEAAAVPAVDVPFEISPKLGIILIIGGFLIRRLKRTCTKNTNFIENASQK